MANEAAAAAHQPVEGDVVQEDPQEVIEQGPDQPIRNFKPSWRNRAVQFVRRIVSQNRRRFQFEGIDLDLAYITDRIIAVGFPAESLEKVLRNPMGHTKEFFKRRHAPGKVKVFNLRGGFLYDPTHFDNNVIYFDMKDHHPPSLELMAPFCREADAWLNAHPENVIAVHCKAGKGRTGVMICALLIYQKFYTNPREILDYYSIVRTMNNKGVTIPSQRRYIYYFNFLREHQLNYFPLRQELVAIYLERPPMTNSRRKTSSIKVKVSNGTYVVFTSNTLHISRDKYREEKASWRDEVDSDLFSPDGTDMVTKRAYCFMVPDTQRVFVEGDVRVDLVNDDKDWLSWEDRKIGHVWFNTMFACQGMCGGDFVYGDQQWPYETPASSIGFKDNIHKSKFEAIRPSFKTFWRIKKPSNWDKEGEESVPKIYQERKIEPPREKIVRDLVEAHRDNIVQDDWNNRRFKQTGNAYNALGSLDPLVAIGGPFQIPRKKDEHVLSFPVFEIDRALKNKKYDDNNGMKLHIVLRCIDSTDTVQSDLAKACCDKTHAEVERQALQAANQIRRYRPDARPSDALGAEKKMPPAVRYAENGGYEGKPHKELTDDKYRNLASASDERWCRYYYRQRVNSESKWPALVSECPLTGKTFNFDKGTSDDGSPPGGAAPGASEESSADEQQSAPEQPTAPEQPSTSDHSDQTNSQESADGSTKTEKQTGSGDTPPNAPQNDDDFKGVDPTTFLLPGQMFLDEFETYDQNDHLVQELRKSYKNAYKAHMGFVDAYRKEGASDEEIKHMIKPDTEHEPLEDPDFVSRAEVPDVNGKRKPEEEVPDHLTALLAKIYFTDSNEVDQQYKEWTIKGKARKHELDYITAERYQRNPELELQANDNHITDMFEKLKSKHSKKMNKIIKLFTRFKRNEVPIQTSPPIYHTTVLDSRCSETLNKYSAEGLLDD